MGLDGNELAGASRMQGRAGRKPQCRRSEVSALRPKPARGAWAAPVLLQKQEQIKGPENASIARFDGLGCYQSRSEISDGFRMQAAWAGTGVGRRAQTGQMACWLPGEAFATAHERFKAAPNSRCAAAVKVQGRFAGWFRAHEARFCCKSRSKFQALKTPPSHGFWGFAAIKAGAKAEMFFWVRAAGACLHWVCTRLACEKQGRAPPAPQR